MATSGEAALDQQRVQAALEQARVFVAGLDQADSARALSSEIRHSPLLTMLDQAIPAAERVSTYLGNAAGQTGASGSRDGGSM